MASGKRKTSVPFKMFLLNINDFIESKYFPDSVEFEWKDPHNMSKDNIIALCNHIRHRQNQCVADDIFRFHAYFNGEEMVAAEYGRQVDMEIAAVRATKQKAARRAKKKNTTKKDLLPLRPGNLPAIDPAPMADGEELQNDNGDIIDGPNDGPPMNLVPTTTVGRLDVAPTVIRDINQGLEPIQESSKNRKSQVMTRSKSIQKGKGRK